VQQRRIPVKESERKKRMSEPRKGGRGGAATDSSEGVRREKEEKGDLPNGRRGGGESGTPVKETEEEKEGDLPNGRRSRAMVKGSPRGLSAAMRKRKRKKRIHQ
jgi:hypothetical protein